MAENGLPKKSEEQTNDTLQQMPVASSQSPPITPANPTSSSNNQSQPTASVSQVNKSIYSPLLQDQTNSSDEVFGAKADNYPISQYKPPSKLKAIIIFFIMVLIGVGAYLQYIKIASVWKSPSGATIHINGGMSCRNKTKDALNLIEKKVEQKYKTMIVNNIGIIKCGYVHTSMDVWAKPPMMNTAGNTLDGDILWYSSSIVHEACHSYLYQNYVKEHPNVKEVPYDVFGNEPGETICVGMQIDIAKDLGMEQKTIDHLKSVVGTRYWENQ